MAVTAANRPRRLGIRARRAVLIAHIAAAGSWLGVDVAMAVLIVTAASTGDPLTRASCLRVLEIVTVWPLLACGLICLATGIALGIGSRWGVTRYWWVTAKLVINVVLTALVPLTLTGEVADQADTARRLLTGEAATVDLADLIYPPTVSPALLLLATALSVIKPWGPIRAVDHRRAAATSGAHETLRRDRAAEGDPRRP